MNELSFKKIDKNTQGYCVFVWLVFQINFYIKKSSLSWCL